VIVLQLKLTKLKLEVLKSNIQRKNKGMHLDKLAITWQNFTRVRIQLKFAFITWLYGFTLEIIKTL